MLVLEVTGGNRSCAAVVAGAVAVYTLVYIGIGLFVRVSCVQRPGLCH
jgi:hypothetical protein